MERNIEKHCYNVWYESSLLVSSQSDNRSATRSSNRTQSTNGRQNGISLTVSCLDSNVYKISNRRVYCYISPKVIYIIQCFFSFFHDEFKFFKYLSIHSLFPFFFFHLVFHSFIQFPIYSFNFPLIHFVSLVFFHLFSQFSYNWLMTKRTYFYVT